MVRWEGRVGIVVFNILIVGLKEKGDKVEVMWVLNIERVLKFSERFKRENFKLIDNEVKIEIDLKKMGLKGEIFWFNSLC